MIRVYKEELDKAGIYIDTLRGPYGGYILNQSLRIPTRKFNKEDIDLFNELIDKNKDMVMKNELIILHDKIRGIYYGNKQENIELTKDNKNIYNILTKAIKEKRKVQLLYYSYNKGELERVIHPIDIYLYNNGWYVSAYCELRNDLRHFEFNRIKNIKLLDEMYE